MRDAMDRQKINIFRQQFSDRFHELLDKRKFQSKGSGRLASVASTFGVSLSAAQKWLSAGAIPEPCKLVEIAEKLDCSVDWLLRGLPGFIPDVAMDSLTSERLAMLDIVGDLVCLPRTSILQKQSGIAPSDGVICLYRDWLRAYAGVDPEHTDAMRVHDDAMHPIVSDGDYVIYRTGITSFSVNGIYLLKVSDSILLRKVQLLLDGTYQVSAENAQYAVQIRTADDFTFLEAANKADGGKINVIGRAELFFKKIKL